MRFTALLVSLLTVSGAAMAHPGTGPAHDLAHAMSGHPAVSDDLLAMSLLALAIIGAVAAILWAVSSRASRDR